MSLHSRSITNELKALWHKASSPTSTKKKEVAEAGMTAQARLPIYLDLASVLGVGECIRRHVHVRESGQGWTDVQAILEISSRPSEGTLP